MDSRQRRSARAARPGALLALLLAAVAPAAAAQVPPGAPYAGRPVTAVRLVGQGRELAEAGLRDLVEVQLGQPLSLAEVRASIVRFLELGRYQDVQVDAVADGAGVALTFQLVPLRVVTGVEFRGDVGLSRGRLRRALDERFGGPPPIGQIEAATDVLREVYAGYGHRGARFTPSLRDEDRGAVLVFDIEAGPRAPIRAIEVAGNPGVTRAQLLDRLDVRPGGEYDRTRLDARLEDYVAGLRARGYYEASATHRVAVSEDGASLDVTLAVETGPLVTVRFEGDPLPPDRQRELVPVAREGSVDEDLLEDADRRIERDLFEQGYWKAAVSHRPVQRDGRLDIVFTIARGPEYRVASVEIEGNRRVPDAELRALVRLEPGQPFVESTLDAGVVAIRRYYTSLGYARADVRTQVSEVPAGPDAGPPAARVTPRIVITEGPRSLIAGVHIEGAAAVAESDLRAALASREGDPYVAARAIADRDALARLYLNRGYQDATVGVDRRILDDERSVELVFVVEEGQQTLVDHVIVVGNTRTATDTILRELPIGPGSPIGFEDLVEAQRRLSALGLFRRVSVSQMRHGDAGLSDLLVSVEEAPATTIGYGGGAEAGRRLKTGAEGGAAEEYIDVSPRGFFEVGRRNLWGKNRSINFFARLAIRRYDNPDEPDTSGLGFNEYRVVGSYREPRALGLDADVLVNGYVEQAVRTSFNFRRRGITAEASKQLDPVYRLSGRYSLGYTETFDERLNEEDQLLIDRLFPEVRLSTFSSSLVRDTRDDPIDPSRGRWIAFDAGVAARWLGSEVGFAKTYLQAFDYRRVSRSRRIVLALGARLGLATGFPREVEVTDENGNPVLDENGEPVVTTVKDLPASERFFAGGDTTVRGFAIDRLGTPDTIDESGFPIGGNGLIVLNTELRVPLWRSVGVVGFVEGGNVYARAGGINLGQLRGSAGFGLRYQSPIGPLRVDLGFKLDRRVIAGRLEPLTAMHISFGQAF